MNQYKTCRDHIYIVEKDEVSNLVPIKRVDVLITTKVTQYDIYSSSKSL